MTAPKTIHDKPLLEQVVDIQTELCEYVGMLRLLGELSTRVAINELPYPEADALGCAVCRIAKDMEKPLDDLEQLEDTLRRLTLTGDRETV